MSNSPFLEDLEEIFHPFLSKIKTRKGGRDLTHSWRNAQAEFTTPCLYLCPNFRNPAQIDLMSCDFDALRGNLIKQDCLPKMNSNYYECRQKRLVPLVAATLDPKMFIAAEKGEIELSARLAYIYDLWAIKL